ncbi:MAG: GTPase (G3E family) [Lachnospiraceae bacterium]|nr:GTPase (G3E family) [Lachnospiraceae bacterium]
MKCRVDLITGFLGSGKTTFLRQYAKHFIDKGERICILENDYGAVNVDLMLLKDLISEKCDMETVAGGCDADCHKRRFKTKLIAMGMQGFDRVIIEPSGVFDMDEFFDTLREDPLDRWYEIGSVIAIVDATLPDELSKASEYMLSSQVACAGRIILSHTDECAGEPEDSVSRILSHLNRSLKTIGCDRTIEAGSVMAGDIRALLPDKIEAVSASGYYMADYRKLYFADDAGFGSVYIMNCDLKKEDIPGLTERLFSDEKYGKVYRIKGFVRDGNNWLEVNAVKKGIEIKPVSEGQDIIIVIGEDLDFSAEELGFKPKNK